MAAQFSAAVDVCALEDLAANLRITLRVLLDLDIGWSRKDGAWTFPLRDAIGNTVGINRRYANGKKCIIAGGHVGLYLPTGIDAAAQLLVAEGATDCAALLDLGFSAVGRFSCDTCSRHVVKLTQRIQPRELIVVADHDEPGQRGAETLASTALVYVPLVRIIMPPTGIKDVRQWKQAGATSSDVKAAISGSATRHLKVKRHAAR